MIEIDGSEQSGSGTILRSSIAICAIINESLHIYNIRQNRPEPGLKPQHLEAVLTAAKLCEAEMEGAKLGSRELWFKPKKIVGGQIDAEIGTAGSISMLLMTVLPMCAYAENLVHLHISKGGTDVPNSPTINYIGRVLLPALNKMGLNVALAVNKYGYYPRGGGEVTVTVTPCKQLSAFRLENMGSIKSVKGISVCTFLADRKVAERQAKSAIQYLKERNCNAEIQVVNDTSNLVQKGSSIVLWAESTTGAILGADSVGELRKPSETVGLEAAEKLWTEINAKPTVDSHLADILVPYVALTGNKSTYLTRELTEHLKANIWLAEKILETKFTVKRKNGLYEIEKV